MEESKKPFNQTKPGIALATIGIVVGIGTLAYVTDYVLKKYDLKPIGRLAAAISGRSYETFQADALEGRIQSFWQTYDQNKDGTITTDEVRAYFLEQEKQR